MRLESATLKDWRGMGSGGTSRTHVREREGANMESSSEMPPFEIPPFEPPNPERFRMAGPRIGPMTRLEIAWHRKIIQDIREFVEGERMHDEDVDVRVSNAHAGHQVRPVPGGVSDVRVQSRPLGQ